MSWQYHPKIECDYFEERVGVWKDIVRFVSNPKAFKEKSHIPLWSFYNLTKISDRELASNGENWRACGANMFSVNALQIDYDSGLTSIDQFIDEHLGLDYALYTSPSHTDAHQKFRVIVPLKEPILNAYLAKGKVRDWMLQDWPGCDKTTINSFRKQRMPAQPMSGDAYRFHIGEGSRLVLDMVEVARLSTLVEESENVVDTFDPDDAQDAFDTPIARLDEARELLRLMNKYALEVPIILKTPRGDGVVHYALTRYTTALAKAGMSRDAMFQWFAGLGVTGQEITRLIQWSTR